MNDLDQTAAAGAGLDVQIPAWQLYLSQPEKAIALATDMLRGASAFTPQLAWAALARAMAQCRSAEIRADPQAIAADFAAARRGFESANDVRGLRLTWLDKAAIAMRMGHWEEALAQYEALIGRFDLSTLHTDNFYLLYGLATAYVYNGRLEEGLRFGYASLHLAEQSNMPAQFATAALPMGVALMAAKDHEEADALLERAIEQAQMAGSAFLSKTLRNNRAVALRRLGRLEEAWEQLRLVLAEPCAMIGGQHFAHFNAAEFFLKRGDTRRAAEHLQIARRIAQPTADDKLSQVKLHFIAGAIASELAARSEALAEFAAVDRLLPEVSALRFNDRAEFYDAYARELARDGQYQEAFEAQRKAAGQYRASIDVVNRVRRFSMRVRDEINRTNAALAHEARERRKLQSVNLMLRKQIDDSLLEAESLRREASYDPLTGTFNRRYLDSTLPDLLRLSQQAATPFALVMLDLDRFKSINDQHGHLMGDAVLRGFARLAKDNLRGFDIIGRYGGEEFCLALIGCGPESAGQRLEGLLARFHGTRFMHEGSGLTGLSFSAGVAVYPEDGTTVDTLTSRADRRLQAAKKQGRRRVVIK